MRSKIIIFIGEGNSEIAFFQEFLKRYFSIIQEDAKSEIVYKINNNFVIFAHPTIGSEKHYGGDKAFSSDKTFADINRKIMSLSYIFGNIKEYEFIYFCLTDKDKINSLNKLDKVEELTKKHCKNFIGKVEKVYAIKEIETWFLAGLGKDFKENYPEIDENELNNFLKNQNIEEIDNTKEILKKVLKNTSIVNTQQYIGREFGRYIDIEQAKEKSSSFEIFLEKVKKIFS